MSDAEVGRLEKETGAAECQFLRAEAMHQGLYLVAPRLVRLLQRSRGDPPVTVLCREGLDRGLCLLISPVPGLSRLGFDVLLDGPCCGLLLRRTGCQVLRAAHHRTRSEEHTSELQSRENLVCRLL